MTGPLTFSKHLQDSAHCRALCSADSSHVLNHAPTGFKLKTKEAIHIQREQPSLNQQLHHVNLKLSIKSSHFHALPLFLLSSFIIIRICPLTISLTSNALYINKLKMTEVSVKTCFTDSKVLPLSLNS